MKPILKWLGGKTRFIKDIEPHIKNIDQFNNYYEPFFGSGALFFHLEIEGKKIINDINPDLINFYNWIKKDYEGLLCEIKKLWKNDSKNDYYEIRSEYNNSKKHSKNKEGRINAARFYFLNKKGFNGVYRVNSFGGFNVPIGDLKPKNIPTLLEFEKFSNKFQNTKILSNNWEDVVRDAQEGDLVYLDPPYFPDESSKFIGYTNPKFDEECHNRLVSIANELVERGVFVLVSNSNSEIFENNIMEANHFKKIVIHAKRNVNPNSNNKDKFIETLYVSNNI